MNIRVNVISEQESQLKLKAKFEKNRTNTIENNISEIIEEESQKSMLYSKKDDCDSSSEDNFEDANDDEQEFFETMSTKSFISNVSLNSSVSTIPINNNRKNNQKLDKLNTELLNLSREKSSLRNKLVE